MDVNKATIERYETHIIDGAVMFYVAGTMKNPEVADTNTAETVTFGATIILGNNEQCRCSSHDSTNWYLY